jgi:hypothetical protein
MRHRVDRSVGQQERLGPFDSGRRQWALETRRVMILPARSVLQSWFLSICYPRVRRTKNELGATLNQPINGQSTACRRFHSIRLANRRRARTECASLCRWNHSVHWNLVFEIWSWRSRFTTVIGLHACLLNSIAWHRSRSAVGRQASCCSIGIWLQFLDTLYKSGHVIINQGQRQRSRIEFYVLLTYAVVQPELPAAALPSCIQGALSILIQWHGPLQDILHQFPGCRLPWCSSHSLGEYVKTSPRGIPTARVKHFYRVDRTPGHHASLCAVLCLLNLRPGYGKVLTETRCLRPSLPPSLPPRSLPLTAYADVEVIASEGAQTGEFLNFPYCRWVERGAGGLG